MGHIHRESKRKHFRCPVVTSAEELSGPTASGPADPPASLTGRGASHPPVLPLLTWAALQ